MEILQPLAIQHIGFAAGCVFGIVGVDQTDVEAPAFQNLEQGDPVYAGELHRNGANVALL